MYLRKEDQFPREQLRWACIFRIFDFCLTKENFEKFYAGNTHRGNSSFLTNTCSAPFIENKTTAMRRHLVVYLSLFRIPRHAEIEFEMTIMFASKLSFIVKILHSKCEEGNKQSGNSFLQVK